LKSASGAFGNSPTLTFKGPVMDHMEDSAASRYARAGVDLRKAGEVTKRIGEIALTTFNDKVLRGIGTFGALYHLGETEGEDLVMVSSVDGVGTKLKVAFAAGKHDTVGADLVNHCVNDILTMGALPLFFMDYLGVGKMEGHIIEDVMMGLGEACRRNKMPLIGGETAEMPGFYKQGEYDLAGFIVGSVRKKSLFDGSRILEGDKIIGLPSNGLHTNGYSLVRRILFEERHEPLFEPLPGTDVALADELLKVHKSYLREVSPLLDMDGLHGMAHVTGGGIVENLPRILPGMVDARIDTDSWETPEIFLYLQEKGGVSRDEMFRVFNMGVGYLLVVSSSIAGKVMRLVEENGGKAVMVGDVVSGDGHVELI